MTRILSVLSIVLPSIALAGAPQLDDAFGLGPYVDLTQEDGGSTTVASTSGREFDMEVNFRGRFMSVPNSILDIWYFSDDPDKEPDPAWVERPKIRAYALGIEFVTKKDSANGIFYFEYAANLMEEGYWDDRENGDIVHDDGEWIIPTDNLGLVNFGADYAYEAFIVRTEDTNGHFGLSFLVGGGLGVGIMVGDVLYIGKDGGLDAIERWENDVEGEPKPGVPPVVPLVDINAGLRFNFGDRAVLRVEGGLHTMLYYGAALGIMF